jgi:hypothetical protein
LIIVVAFLLPVTGAEKEVTLPLDTRVYVVTQTALVGKKKQLSVGDLVPANVWRDVVVDGHVLIEAESPVLAKVDSLKTRKVAGIKGKISIAALETEAVDGQAIQLTGGYMKKGSGRIPLATSLALFVAWPLIFIPGKVAKLPAGTVFDSYTGLEYTLTLDVEATPELDPTALSSRFAVEVLYEYLGKQDEPRTFPLRVYTPTDAPASFVVDSVNGTPIQPIPLTVNQVWEEEDQLLMNANVSIKALSKHFRKGINWFEVSYHYEEERIGTEVVLNLQY